MKTYKKILFTLLFGVSVITLPNYTLATTATDQDDTAESTISNQDLQHLSTVIANVKKYYYKSVDEKKLLDSAMSGMLSGLDPHSAYLGPDDLKDLQMETRGKFGGIGVEVIPDQGAIKVISPLDDTPAYRAGIKSGDYIIQINAKLVRDMSLRDAINMMRGPKGSKLSLIILRKNTLKPLVFNLHREIISIQTIKQKMLEPGYAYIRLAFFQEPTAKDLNRAIHLLQKQAHHNLSGLVLDLRNNPGGLFDSAVQVADYFLDANKFKDNDLIVYTKGQDDQIQMIEKATANELLPNVPLVVLINEGSASAAEIVAGALQDHKRAVIVGTRSFGKGSVQTLIPIDNHSAIKLTTALYYTPLGRSIQAKGIEPDVIVTDMQISHNQDRTNLPRIDESNLIDHITNGNDDTDKNTLKNIAADPQRQTRAMLDLAAKDYQLYEALQILKSMSVMRQHKNN